MMSGRLQFMLVAASALGIAASCTATDDAQSATVETTTSSSTSALPRSEERRVREQLAGFDLPNDAVGKSGKVSGGIAFDADGRLLPAGSRFAVDASTFVSDRERRDSYVGARLLNAQQFPEVVFVPTEVRGVKLPVVGTESSSFEVLGDLTVRGVTRPTVWRVRAKLEDGRVSGTASTRFVFDDFQMEKPRVRSVLSVADTIGLEYDFNLVREDTGD